MCHTTPICETKDYLLIRMTNGSNYGNFIKDFKIKNFIVMNIFIFIVINNTL